MTCPKCCGPAEKAIWCGIPFWCCTNHGDNLVAFGAMSYLLGVVMSTVFPFDGTVMVYTGPYPFALWSWLTGRVE